MDSKEFDIDSVIAKLLSVQHKKPGTLVDLDLDIIQIIIHKALKVIQSQGMLLQIKAPMTIGTDIHG